MLETDLALHIDSEPMAKKNKAAQELGSLGGKARAQKLTEAERKKSSAKALRARWDRMTLEERREATETMRAGRARNRKK